METVPTNVTLLPQPVPSLSADQTSLSTAQANSIRSANLEAADWNTRDQWMFDNAVRGYNAQMAAGALTPPAVPVAPPKWVVEPPLPPDGFAAAVQSPTEKLKSSIPLATFNAAVPIVYPPGTADIGHQIGDSVFYTVMPDDTMPGGSPVLGPDGHEYRKQVNPWSKVGLYVRET